MDVMEALQERIRQAPAPMIAARIKQARRAQITEDGKSWSHDRLGEEMGGVTRQHLIKLEKGLHRPRAEMLTRIADATGRDVDWFLDPEVDPVRKALAA